MQRLLGLVLAVSLGCPPAVHAQSGCPDCEPADAHVAFATFYDLKSFAASLILNHKGPERRPAAWLRPPAAEKR